MLQYHTIPIYIYRYIYYLYLIYLCNILKRYLFDFIGECRYHNCCCFSYHLFIQVYKHIYIYIYAYFIHICTCGIDELLRSLLSDTPSLSCLFAQILLLSAVSSPNYCSQLHLVLATSWHTIQLRSLTRKFPFKTSFDHRHLALGEHRKLTYGIKIEIRRIPIMIN